jgi:dTDP-glucose 4,6-dehydratase
MSPLHDDLDDVLALAEDDLRTLRGTRLLITGATGFVGSWLVETLVHANRRLHLDARVVLLTRRPAAYHVTHPHLAGDAAITLLEGDIRTFRTAERVDAVIHAATPASAAFNDAQPGEMVSTIVDGMRHVLDWSAEHARGPVLFTSSGAVYGVQPPDLAQVPETFLGGPDPLDPRAAYHEGKRLAELMGAIATESGVVDVKVARLFAFVGPYLPIDAHFAVGNFVRDVLRGGPVVVGGDGTPLRSYLYASDLAVWLWAILTRGVANRAYNVGSDQAMSIAEVADAVARASAQPVQVEIRQTPIPGAPPAQYVPSTLRARSELGLVPRVDFDDAVRRTLRWHRHRLAQQEER